MDVVASVTSCCGGWCCYTALQASDWRTINSCAFIYAKELKVVKEKTVTKAKVKAIPKIEEVVIPKVEEIEQPIKKQSSQSKNQASQSGA